MRPNQNFYDLKKHRKVQSGYGVLKKVATYRTNGFWKWGFGKTWKGSNSTEFIQIIVWAICAKHRLPL